MPSHVNLLNENNGQPTTPTPSPSEDLSLEDLKCITCDSLDIYTDLSKGYIDAISLALYDPVLTVFASLVGLWVVVSGLQIWLAMVSPVHIMRGFISKSEANQQKAFPAMQTLLGRRRGLMMCASMTMSAMNRLRR